MPLPIGFLNQHHVKELFQVLCFEDTFSSSKLTHLLHYCFALSRFMALIFLLDGMVSWIDIQAIHNYERANARHILSWDHENTFELIQNYNFHLIIGCEVGLVRIFYDGGKFIDEFDCDCGT